MQSHSVGSGHLTGNPAPSHGKTEKELSQLTHSVERPETQCTYCLNLPIHHPSCGVTPQQRDTSFPVSCWSASCKVCHLFHDRRSPRIRAKKHIGTRPHPTKLPLLVS